VSLRGIVATNNLHTGISRRINVVSQTKLEFMVDTNSCDVSGLASLDIRLPQILFLNFLLIEEMTKYCVCMIS